MAAITASRAEPFLIGELSKHSGVNIETIRYYERVRSSQASRARIRRARSPIAAPYETRLRSPLSHRRGGRLPLRGGAGHNLTRS